MPKTKPPKFRVYDSGTSQEFPDHKMHAVAYEVNWQRVRMACSFVDLESVRGSCTRLEAYISLQKDPEDRKQRLWRVRNLMAALPLGQSSSRTGIHMVSVDEEHTIVAYRENVATRLDAIGKPTEWNWNVARIGLRQAWKTDPQFVADLCANLKHRSARSDPKPELRYFLKLAEETGDA